MKYGFNDPILTGLSDGQTYIIDGVECVYRSPRPDLIAIAVKIDATLAEAAKPRGHTRAALHYDDAPAVSFALRQNARFRLGILAIALACVEGRVCPDVAWFTAIPAETLFDKCCNLLEEDLPQDPEGLLALCQATSKQT